MTEPNKTPSERQAIVHDLKVWQPYFHYLDIGIKTFEIRKNDRDFRVGDTLRLREYDDDEMLYSGSELQMQVCYIAQGVFGLPDDMCVMSLCKRTRPARDDGWTAVEDGLPDNGHTKQITYRGPNGLDTEYGRYVNGVWCWSNGRPSRVEVIAWRERPEPYIGEPNATKGQRHGER